MPVKDDYRLKSIVERSIRTYRNLIHKYQSAYDTMVYIGVLPKLTENFNTSVNRNLDCSPLEMLNNPELNENFVKKVAAKNELASRQAMSKR